MNNIKVIYCVLILAILATWCNARATMEGLEDGDFNDETREIARELLKRFFNKRCTSAGSPCSAGTSCCDASNSGGICACNTGTDNCFCTYGGAFAKDFGGPVAQRKRYEGKY
ncbi:unnamed protein product [Adineta steineri]|uniref:Uncharacterized protein n=1 Tax=Adineta steineri TaxID=433720 RepID=A0A815HIT9_9BILA|nr:unnamed protein product [Adineta steineri]CAF1352983.1 unnamed protein product [Adineta steineri]CAF1364961.1 unnamed protein product [Adineta steineri]CAF3793523.1 unnamed protein product [Adineta steineri]CAF3832334.1 unnamed protein product [Adineta steineri]